MDIFTTLFKSSSTYIKLYGKAGNFFDWLYLKMRFLKPFWVSL